MTVMVWDQTRAEDGSMLTLEVKTARLREVEHCCYQAAYHLLQHESAAREAAEEALLELFRTEGYFVQGEQERVRMARTAALRQALALRSRSLEQTAGA